MGKLKYLDGIRGLMAINVIICHFICVYYPQMYWASWGGVDGGKFLNLFATTPLSIFVNGNIAVQYFFVLTGFLVGRSAFISNELKDNLVLKKSVNRYVRLLPVCIMATLFTVLTMVLQLQNHLNIVDIAWNGSFMLDYCNFTPTFANIINNLFLKPFISGSDYVGPFWTIKYEFWGYILTLLAVVVLRKSRLRRVAYFVIIYLLLFLDSNYVGFFGGLFVADLVYCKDKKTTILSGIYDKWLYKMPTLVILSIIGLYFASCPMSFSGIHTFLKFVPLLNPSIFRAMGCCVLVFCLTQSKRVYKIFEIKPLMFLGKISFSIYAFHWPLMLTLEAWLFKVFIGNMSYHLATGLSFIITFVAIIIVAYLISLVEKRIKLNTDKFIDSTTLKENTTNVE